MLADKLRRPRGLSTIVIGEEIAESREGHPCWGPRSSCRCLGGPVIPVRFRMEPSQ